MKPTLLRSVLVLAPVLALAACSAAATVGADIAKAAPIVCPDFDFIPAGAEVCSTIALAVEGFLEFWATTHPASATAAAVTAAKARKVAVDAGAAPAPAALVKMVRVGNLGAFPPAIAAELVQPEMAAACKAYLATHLATDAGADARAD